MEPMKPEVMRNQVADLPNVLVEQTKVFDRIVRNLLTPLEYRSLHRVYTVGDGDSFHASLATELAFELIGKISCEPLSAQRFLDYGADFIPTSFPNDTLVVGTSASGGTARVAQSLEKAAKISPNIITVGMTGNPEGKVPKAAQRVLGLVLPDLGRSPGIRTYHASLMGLLLIAIRIGEMQDRLHQEDANVLRKEIAGLAEICAKTAAISDAPAQKIAQSVKDAQFMMFVGSGPSFGTAIFSAAKVVEAAGVMAMGQDLEEWWHVEKFTYPANSPLFIIAPPGRSYWRAAELAKTAHDMGRRIFAIVQEDDKDIAGLAEAVLPVAGSVREEFSPLVYHIAADLFASYLAEALGRALFMTDNSAVRTMMEGNRPRPTEPAPAQH